MEEVYTRKGATIIDPQGKIQNYDSINEAKKASWEIQKKGKGLGRGDLQVRL